MYIFYESVNLLSEMLHTSFSKTFNKLKDLIIPLQLKNECCQSVATIKDSNT